MDSRTISPSIPSSRSLNRSSCANIEKGGTAATVKDAVDAAIDQLQSEADKHKNMVKDAALRLGDKLRTPEK